MNSEILVTKPDYSRLNSMILNMLETSESDIFELNRLNMEIKRAKKVDPGKIPAEYVTMNSIVKLRDTTTGSSHTVKLVYPQFASAKEVNISVLSPLGCALLGYKKDEEITFKVPGGSSTVIIEDILFQPEAFGLDRKY
jgi:regulator of nucleoside diphosphate kinase